MPKVSETLQILYACPNRVIPWQYYQFNINLGSGYQFNINITLINQYSIADKSGILTASALTIELTIPFYLQLRLAVNKARHPVLAHRWKR
jgi:hypothetical protein